MKGGGGQKESKNIADVIYGGSLKAVLLQLQEELHVRDPLETRPADRPVGVVLLQMEDAFTASFDIRFIHLA